ncbi:hypothetical protein [Luteipulveratus halotolerans]|uniref:hypothetical protein n=1 Tax=Luteipulveratus halotolerans TaxID=1631356 RepID=UPI001E5C012C|nr:hypothetical protein [Luteipulveratus halotolerans]
MLLLDWLSRYRYATAPQLARLCTGSSVRYLDRRLRQLCRVGYLHSARPLAGIPRIFAHTAAGAAAANRSYPKPTLSLGTVKHTLLCTDVAISYALLGHESVSERQVMEVDYWDGRTQVDPLTYAPFHQTGRKFPHMPDLVALPVPDDFKVSETLGDEAEILATRFPFPAHPGLDGKPLPWAVEVELTTKKRPEISRVLTGYGQSRHLAGVIYYATERSTATALSRTAQELGLLGTRVHVKRLRAHGEMR